MVQFGAHPKTGGLRQRDIHISFQHIIPVTRTLAVGKSHGSRKVPEENGLGQVQVSRIVIDKTRIRAAVEKLCIHYIGGCLTLAQLVKMADASVKGLESAFFQLTAYHRQLGHGHIGG